MFKTFVCGLLICCCCMALYAEQVTLKNGDRLTGTIVSVSDKKLVLKTEHAGEFSLTGTRWRSFPPSSPWW